MEKAKKISIMLMHDDGRNNRYRISLTLYKTLWACLILLPLLGSCAIWGAVYLWQKNATLVANASRLELAMREAQSVAEKLSNLRELLEQQDTAAAGAVLQNLSRQNPKEAPPILAPQAGSEEADSAAEAGPGHTDFPVVDTKAVNIENVTARLVGLGKIRINLDLRNPDPKRSIVGHVSCTFIAGSGETFPLLLPSDQADFKISRFKRVVFQPAVPPSVSDTTNARILIEVHTDETTLAYRNLFPVER